MEWLHAQSTMPFGIYRHFPVPNCSFFFFLNWLCVVITFPLPCFFIVILYNTDHLFTWSWIHDTSKCRILYSQLTFTWPGYFLPYRQSLDIFPTSSWLHNWHHTHCIRPVSSTCITLVYQTCIRFPDWYFRQSIIRGVFTASVVGACPLAHLHTLHAGT